MVGELYRKGSKQFATRLPAVGRAKSVEQTGSNIHAGFSTLLGERAAGRAGDDGVAGRVFKRVEAESANYPSGEGAVFRSGVQIAGEQGADEHQAAAAAQCPQHEISDRQFHEQVGC